MGPISELTRTIGAQLGSVLFVLNLLTASVCWAEVASDRWIVAHVGTLLAKPGMPTVHEYSIIIRGDRIESIRPGYVEPQSIHSEAQ